MGITVKVEGLSELKNALEQLPKATNKTVMRKVLMARAKPIAEAAKSYVPVKSGLLRDSIIASTRLSKRQKREAKETASYVEVYAGPGPLPYAHLVEFGSIHEPRPAPFMRPAWDSAKGSLLNNIKDDLWAEIRKAVDKLARKAARGGGE
jgi:HK97 gp10 family phage protein